MQDVPYCREKAGIAALLCGSRNNNIADKTSTGKTLNAILT
jgi:hypothetical protein